MLLQIVGEHFPQMPMRLNKTGDIGKILEPLALSSLWFGPGLHLAFESVLKRGDSQEDAVYISSDGTGREIPIEILRTELNTHRRAPLEVDGPLESLAVESYLLSIKFLSNSSE